MVKYFDTTFDMHDTFLAQYVNRPVQYGFGALGYIVSKRYSRLKEDGTGENWYDIVKRVVEGSYAIQKRHIESIGKQWNNRKATESSQRMFDEMFNMHWCPGGRGIYAMGTKIVEMKGGAALNNCFSGDTKFLVKDKGLVRLSDVVDMEVDVLNINGAWSKASVHAFGVQQLQKVVLRPKGLKTNMSINFDCTKNHTWILSDGTKTTELKVGDDVCLYTNNFDSELDKKQYDLGFGYGYLLGEKTQHTEWDTIPKNENETFVKGFIAGLIIAGARSKPHGTYILDMENQEACEWIIKNAFRAGYVPTDFTIKDNKTNRKRKFPQYRVSLCKTDKYAFKVDAIIDTNKTEEVYCVTEPETHTFTLEYGIRTGNCGFVSTKDLRIDPIGPYVWLMRESMYGVGVGFDVRGAGQVLVMKPNISRTPITYTIPDSREGWVESVKLLLEAYLANGPDVVFNYSELRVKGTPLKIFGGVSSGPAPLIEMHVTLRQILERNVGHPITETTIVDINNVLGKCVVSGGIRRTAEIALGFMSDEFLNLKNYFANPERAAWGWVSNNSILANIGDDYTQIAERIYDNGEPGVCWLGNMRKYSRMHDQPDNRDQLADGANPCVTGDTWVMTSNGPMRVTDLLGKEFKAVVNGKSYDCKTGFFKTGTKPVYELLTEDGHKVKLTDCHKVFHVAKMTPHRKYENLVDAKDLCVGDTVVLNNNRAKLHWIGNNETFNEGWLLGALFGDGHINAQDKACVLQFRGKTRYKMIKLAKERLLSLNCNENDMKTDEMANVDGEFLDIDMSYTRSTVLYKYLTKFKIDDNKNVNDPDSFLKASSDFQAGFLRGFIDTNEFAQKNKNKEIFIRMSATRLQHLHIVQQMLLNFGICSKIHETRSNKRHKTNKKYFGPNLFSHVLIISKDNVNVFVDTINLDEPTKKMNVNHLLDKQKRLLQSERFVTTVKSLTYVGVEDVFDCTVDNVHCFSANGLLVHNCCEQTLRSFELCNLVEVFINRILTLEKFLEVLKSAFLYAKSVTLVMTDCEETNEIIKQNRRIGVSISGVAQFLGKHSYAELQKWLEIGYAKLKYYDTIYSSWLDVNESIKITSNKPGGSVCCIVGATSGLSDPISRFFIRRVRLAHGDELIDQLRADGYNIIDDVPNESNTTIVEIPVDVGEGIRDSDDVSMWEQLNRCAFFQKYWADNQVSATIMFNKKTDTPTHIKVALQQYETQLKGIAFLPRTENNYLYPPYEKITEEKYKELMSKIKVNTAYVTTVDPEQERGCDGDSCSLIGLAKKRKADNTEEPDEPSKKRKTAKVKHDELTKKRKADENEDGNENIRHVKQRISN